jgi:hypothetical protein
MVLEQDKITAAARPSSAERHTSLRVVASIPINGGGTGERGDRI